MQVMCMKVFILSRNTALTEAADFSELNFITKQTNQKKYLQYQWSIIDC